MVLQELDEVAVGILDERDRHRPTVELLRLTRFLRSDDPAAVAFRDSYHRSPRACEGHAPGGCDLCGATCLRESLVREVETVERGS